MYSAQIKLFSFFLHGIISEHAAIDFQPTAQARTACTKMFCLHAQRLFLVETNFKVWCGPNTYLLWKITSRKYSENMMKILIHPTYFDTMCSKFCKNVLCHKSQQVTYWVALFKNVFSKNELFSCKHPKSFL